MVSGTRQKLKRIKTRHRQAIQTKKTPVFTFKAFVYRFRNSTIHHKTTTNF